MNKKILIIEDDPNIADIVEINIKDIGCELDRAEDGVSGLKKILDRNYDLVILDIMLPKLNGLDVCKQIRSLEKYTPIVMLTAKSEEFDKVLGLELGADEYITKPFSVRELIARIKAIFRLQEASVDEQSSHPKVKEIKFGQLIINFEKRLVMLSDKVLELTAKEFDLLAIFAAHPGRSYSRQELLNLVWGYNFDGYEHTVNSHINRLRSKIEDDPTDPKYIKTVWGFGYRFAESLEFTE